VVVSESDPGFAFKDPKRRAKLEAAFPAIEKAIDAEMKAQALPGLVVGIVFDGELAFSKGFGVTAPGGKAPDADTVYRIGSITKSFTGLAALALRDAGTLQLDDPLAKYIPEATQLVYPSRDSAAITLRQLANHTSGLPRMGPFEPENGPTEEVVVKALPKLALETAPGTNWKYSNLAFSLLGIALGRAAKAPYHDVVATHILKPLGMTATTWDHQGIGERLAPPTLPSPKGPITSPQAPARLGAADGAGGIFSSTRDMAKYIAFQLAAYPPRSAEDPGPLRRSTLREAHATGVPAGLKHSLPAIALSYGFGWNRLQSCELDDMVGHGGGIDSYRSDIRFSPSRGVGVIVMTNFGNANPNAFTDKVLAELGKTGAFVARAPSSSKALETAMSRLLAIYQTWDEAAFAKILARPIDPREKDELATYHKLHGACTGFEPATIETASAGSFTLKCERGVLEMELSVDGTGQIQGFFGFSRGVEPPPALAKTASALLSLAAKWDDKLATKVFPKGPTPMEQRKKLAATFHERHGDCKIAGAIHLGFDWGYEVKCKKEDVEMFILHAPGDATKVDGLQLRPVHGAPKRCN
ncbi:MAG: beta-lactamase family protein, partial [Deltaproteobacteria bacterium]|nr:beta-lactamase family protein [Deltaproteobacteria bacterium]